MASPINQIHPRAYCTNIGYITKMRCGEYNPNDKRIIPAWNEGNHLIYRAELPTRLCITIWGEFSMLNGLLALRPTWVEQSPPICVMASGIVVLGVCDWLTRVSNAA